MSKKRKDNKGRILRIGESQRPDGRYAYSYVTNNGKQKCMYSWKLEATDSVPQGKRNDVCLREKIKKLQKDLNDGIVTDGNLTVLKLVKRYISHRNDTKFKTEYNYKYVTKCIIEDDFGDYLVDKVKLSDAKEFCIRSQKEEHRSFNTIRGLVGVLRPAFQMAVDDDLIRKNPFNFTLSKVIKKDEVKREALTEGQEKSFLEFVKQDSVYKNRYNAIYILFNTGIRISEFAGLTVSDINFKEKKINILNQLQKRKSGDYFLQATKSKSGIREIPMMNLEVYRCFKSIIKNRKKPMVEPIVEGKMGFLYLNQFDMPMTDLNWEKTFRGIVKKYNKTHEIKIPTVTPHVCRHTFCSKMVRQGMNPKVLQYIMGHSNISITLDRYAHVNFDDIQAEVERIAV